VERQTGNCLSANRLKSSQFSVVKPGAQPILVKRLLVVGLCEHSRASCHSLHFGSTTPIYTSFPDCQRIDNALGHCHDVPTADINRVCRKMGMVFQHFNLFAHLTVLQNIIETPMTVKAAARDEITPKHLNRTIVC
jgi:hypothetical protein